MYGRRKNKNNEHITLRLCQLTKIRICFVYLSYFSLSYSFPMILFTAYSTPVVPDDIFGISETSGVNDRTSFMDISMFSRLDEGEYECSVNSRSKSLRIMLTAPPGKEKGCMITSIYYLFFYSFSITA